MAIIGSLSAVRAQTAWSVRLSAALDYVARVQSEGSPERARLFALAPGENVKVDLGHGMFSIDAAYPSKARANAFFETHRKYIDVQAVYEGEEAMEMVDRDCLQVEVPYNAEKDVIKYRDYTDTSVLRAENGVVLVFFPVDGHMAHLVNESVLIRKIVVKVPVD